MKKVRSVLLGLVLLVVVSSCKKSEKVAQQEKVLMVSTIGGSGGQGYADGSGTLSAFNNAAGITSDAAGNVFVCDFRNHCIRKITPEGVVSTVAGKGGESGNVDGPGTTARFQFPTGIVVDPTGNLYVTDNDNLIRKITPAGVVSTLTGMAGGGYLDGPLASAKFSGLANITIDVNNNLYVADNSSNRIRKITASGIVSTIAGTGNSGSLDGPIVTATIGNPIGIAVDASGNVFVSTVEAFRMLIRKITPNGIVSTLAGANGLAPGYKDGLGLTAKFNEPNGLCIDPAGNLYVADGINGCIRKITPQGVVSTIAGNPNGISPTKVNDPLATGYIDGLAKEARFNYPYGVTTDAKGNLYVTDKSNNTVRKISLEVKDNGVKTQAQLDQENWNKPKNLK